MMKATFHLLAACSLLLLLSSQSTATPSSFRIRQAKTKSINCNSIYTKKGTLVIADVNKLLQAAADAKDGSKDDDKPDGGDKPVGDDKPSNTGQPPDGDKPTGDDKPTNVDKPADDDKSSDKPMPTDDDKSMDVDKPNNEDQSPKDDMPDGNKSKSSPVTIAPISKTADLRPPTNTSDDVVSPTDVPGDLSMSKMDCYACQTYGGRKRATKKRRGTVAYIYNQLEVEADTIWKTGQRLRRDLEDDEKASDAKLVANGNDNVNPIFDETGGVKSDSETGDIPPSDIPPSDAPPSDMDSDSAKPTEATASNEMANDDQSGDKASNATADDGDMPKIDTKDTHMAVGIVGGGGGDDAAKMCDGVPFEQAVEFTFNACSEIDDMGYEEAQTQTMHIWQGHLSPSASSDMCVAADKVGIKTGKLILEKCMFNNDMSQAKQLWQLTQQRQQEGSTARISFYLTFLGEPKKDKNLAAGRYDGSYSLRMKEGHLIVSAGLAGPGTKPSDDTDKDKKDDGPGTKPSDDADKDKKDDTPDDESVLDDTSDTAPPSNEDDMGHVVYLHMGDARIGRRSQNRRSSTENPILRRNLANLSKYEAAFENAEQARNVMFEPGQF